MKTLFWTFHLAVLFMLGQVAYYEATKPEATTTVDISVPAVEDQAAFFQKLDRHTGMRREKRHGR